MRYDYLIVGSGLFGSVLAQQAAEHGKKCLVIDRRPHCGGNLYCEEIEGICVHTYGAHIFHTSDKEVWEYVNRFVTFNNYINAPVANYKGELYNLPFNMNTFCRIFDGVRTPQEAKARIAAEIASEQIGKPANLEEQAISMVGRTVYEKLVKGYTEKQWGRDCAALPAFIIRRLPLRFVFDNNYFNDRWQGIPEEGYNALIGRLLEGADVRLNTDYFDFIEETGRDAFEKIVFTGPIDRFYGYRFGALEYRSVRFETEVLDTDNYQGNAVINYTDHETPYTRIIEHKHFVFGKQPKTVISREYSAEWRVGEEPYYPVNDEKNGQMYAKYAALASAEPNVLFGGRLGRYKYYDMDKVIGEALALAKRLFG